MTLTFVTPKRRARLTWPEVRAIREAYADGAILRTLAEEYDITQVAIHLIVLAKRWRDDPLHGPAVPAPYRKPHKPKGEP